MKALLTLELTIVTKVTEKQRILKGEGPKNRTREKFESTAKPPKGIQERKLDRKFHLDWSIFKYLQIRGK